MNNQYIKLLQKRTGQLAIGRSTLRNQGAPGVVDSARTYLKNMNLTPIRKMSSEIEFKRFLQRHTLSLCESFPRKARKNWGAARKALNIFLRDCLYNQYLCKYHKLNRVERWLEVPLDKDVGTRIYEIHSNKLTKWSSIKSLDLKTSEKYQDCASLIAKCERIARVHLDIKYWRDGNY